MFSGLSKIFNSFPFLLFLTFFRLMHMGRHRERLTSGAVQVSKRTNYFIFIGISFILLRIEDTVVA
jgi:hypothetical protein